MPTSVCPYCGCACFLNIDKNKTTTANKPNIYPCIKGLTVHEPLQTNRLTKVLIRKNKNKPFKEVTWKQAYKFIAQNLKDTITKYGPESIYFTTSGEFSNETNYLIFKLATTFKTANVDSCARLCHAATGYVWKKALGIKGIPKYTMEDLKDGDLFLYIGSDPAENYPSLFMQINKAIAKGATLMVVDVMPTTTWQRAQEKFLISSPDLTGFLIGLVYTLYKHPIIAKNIKALDNNQQFTKSLNSLKDIASKYIKKYKTIIKTITDKLIKATSQNQKIFIGHGMGITQHINGTNNVIAVTNLALIVNGNLFPGRGKVNVQGCDDISRSFILDNLPFAPITDALYKEASKFLWITAMNPLHSFPDTNKLKESLKDTFVVLTHHHPTETQEIANVILPTTLLPEEGGTVINLERRIRYVNPLGILPKDSEIKATWQIFSEFWKVYFNKSLLYKDIFDITHEWIDLNPLVPKYLKNQSKEKLLMLLRQDDSFLIKKPKFKKLLPLNFTIENQVSEEFPYIATTARSKFHFCSGETTRSSATLNKLESKHIAYINNKLANKLNIEENNTVKIKSKIGSIETLIKISENVAPNTIVLAYHFDKPLVNSITPLILDPITKTPQFKYIAVNIEKIST